MKKLCLLAFLAFFIIGCGQSAVRSEFYEHDTVYKNWDHMKYSWFGHRNPTPEDGIKSVEQGWWGIEVPYVPGQQKTTE